MKRIVWLILAIAGVLTTENAGAQHREECGRMKVNEQAQQKAEEAIAAGRTAAVSRIVKVYFHVFTDGNGVNAAATSAEMQAEYEKLVQNYAPDGLCFANMGVRFIENTQMNWNHNPDNENDVDDLIDLLVPGCLNVFVHRDLPDDLRGTAYNIPNIFCSVAQSGLGAPQSITHEIGHCLGLSHTFAGCSNQYIAINALNCGITGDRVCDTPADPYCFFDPDNTTCFSTTSVNFFYNGNCEDAAGATNWTPSYGNIMSYWYNFGHPRSNFTSGQFARINGFLESDIPLQTTTTTTNAIALSSTTQSSGMYYRAAITSITAGGGTQFSGSADVSLASKAVILNPGFIANPSSGDVVIRGMPCN